MLMNTLAILRGTFGNFRALSLTTSTYVNLHRDYTITWNARYHQLVNTIILMNTLAILRGTFGNFRPLSLTTSTCVNLHRDLYHYLERALSPTCEHYNFNKHPRNPSGYFRSLSTTIIGYFGLRQSSKTPTITSNARYCQLVNIAIHTYIHILYLCSKFTD